MGELLAPEQFMQCRIMQLDDPVAVEAKQGLIHVPDHGFEVAKVRFLFLPDVSECIHDAVETKFHTALPTGIGRKVRAEIVVLNGRKHGFEFAVSAVDVAKQFRYEQQCQQSAPDGHHPVIALQGGSGDRNQYRNQGQPDQDADFKTGLFHHLKSHIF